MRDEGIVDVEKRKEQVEYVLGDPTIFPPELLSWLKRFIEQSGIQLPASSIFGTFSAGTGSVRNLAAGIVLPFAGPNPPPGSLAANGQSVSRAEYPKLFEAIGVTYGAVDANTFNLPDYRDRALYGVGVALPAVTMNDGLPNGSRSPRHKHTLNWNDPGHGHGVTDGGHSHGGGVIGATHNPFNGNLLVQNGTVNLQATEIVGIPGSGANIGVSAAATGISASVGPQENPNVDAPAYHAVLYVITTG